jgi:hypothetical protein
MRPLLLGTAFVLSAVGALVTARPAAGQADLSTDALGVRIDQRGQVVSLLDRQHGREYLPSGQAAPLLSIKTAAGGIDPPSVLAYDPKTGIVTLTYAARGVRARVKATRKPTHLVLEIVGIEPANTVDAVVWGPYPTTIGETVGEIIGVVRNAEFAIGIQVLNLKTLGGYPINDEGSDPSRSNVAQAKPFGSVLQAFSLDRSRPRRVAGWVGQFPNMPVPPIPGETVVGSSIAIFGCPAAVTLERIGAIEVAEHLPHPLVDGQWVKQWRDLGRSYLIAPFTEATVDALLDYTRRANLMSLYHPGPFASWGHYGLDPAAFPSGNAGMKRAVEKGKALGIRIGVHTLTNFINTDDAYVTPVPDPRLAVTGRSLLIEDVNATATGIRVALPEYFDNEKANWLHAVVIDQELIRYRAVSSSAPWTLLDCQRGAFGTRPAAHTKNATVGKLLDHPYKVFFPTLEMQDEIARNLAKWFNETGVSHMDFDGHEGCWASGQGDYALERFAKVFYDNLDHPVVNGTSTSEPFYWHINTYCNWGEPWYGGFRESMQEYRINNQVLFECNYVPHMLGWYRLTGTTSLPEMEWMLARAAGYNAGFAISTTLGELRKNADTPILLDAIREWETARRSGAFSISQRERLKNARLEFHLEALGPNRWNLYPFHASDVFRHERVARQPGEPAAARWTLTNMDEAQPLQFRLQVVGESGAIRTLDFEVDGTATLCFDVELKAGESLACDGTPIARIYDAKGQQTRTVASTAPIPRVSGGTHAIVFDCSFSGEPVPRVEVTFRTRGAAEPVAIAR